MAKRVAAAVGVGVGRGRTTLLMSSVAAGAEVFKILPAALWRQVKADAAAWIPELPVDTQSGFIHFSEARQLRGTLLRFFRPTDDVVILKVPVDLLRRECREQPGGSASAEVRWDLAPSVGDHFAHLYHCRIPIAAVVAEAAVAWDAAGQPQCPFLE